MTRGPGTFLCGCSVEGMKQRYYTTHLLPDGLTFTNNRLDSEGFIVCPWHGKRRYGWASIPASSNHPGPKHPYMSMSPLERERRIMFGGKIPTVRPLKINSTVPDTRDNRDPQGDEMQKVVQAALAEIRSSGNGHANRT